MTDEEWNDLVELKAFLERAIPEIEKQLIHYPVDGSTENYQFLIDKAVMYREVLNAIKRQLEPGK